MPYNFATPSQKERDGMTAAGAPPEPDDVSFILPDWSNNAYLLAGVTSFCFFGAALFIHLRGTA